jgi:hypothetical protein
MISCLCVTHERHEFLPWVEHQFLKQRASSDELIIVDSSERPWVSAVASVVHVPGVQGIAEKRTIALEYGRQPLISWFDDDDWQHPEKLHKAPYFLERAAAVGCRHASMYSTLTGKVTHYESRFEPIIFNSAVYRRSAVPPTFDHRKVTAEDTEWQERFFQSRPTFITLGEPMHAWLCHTKNITNKSSSRFFDKPNDIPFDAWELEFLKGLHK